MPHRNRDSSWESNGSLRCAGMDSEKVGVLEPGQTVGLALKRQNEAGMIRCKLVLPSNGAVAWCAAPGCPFLLNA